MCQTGPFSGYHFQKRGLFFMLPFFARTLTRREMALGCAVLSLALLLSTLPAALRWGQAQLDTGALLCADTLRFHIRADSDSPCRPDRQARRAGCCSDLRRCPLHRTGQACRPALGGREPARTGADGPGRAGKTGDLFHRYGTTGGNVLRYHPLFHRHPARRAVSGSAHRPGRQRPSRQKLVVRALPGAVPLCLRHLRPAGGKRSGVWVVCGAVQVCGVVAAGDGEPGG